MILVFSHPPHPSPDFRNPKDHLMAYSKTPGRVFKTIKHYYFVFHAKTQYVHKAKLSTTITKVIM